MSQGVRRTLTGALVLLVAWEVARSLGRIDGVVFHDYLRVGQVVLQHGDPYATLSFDTWPPFFIFIAVALTELARISRVGALLLWQLGSVAAGWGAYRLLPRLAGAAPEPLTASATLVPLLMTARLLMEHLESTQINLYLLFLVLVAFDLFRRRRYTLGGLALASAVSARAVPILFLAYLVYKRAWRPAVWTTGFLVVLNVVLPLAVFGPALTMERWKEWRAVATAETANPTPMFPNQSLLAALRRVLTREGGARDPIQYAVAAWPPSRVVPLFYALLGVAALALAFAFRRNPRGLDDPSMLSELAVGLCILPIVSPLAWKAHFVTLLAGYWLIWRVMQRTQVRRRWVWALWWGSFACLTLSAPALISTAGRSVAESLNVITAGALIVVGLTIWAARQLPLQPPASGAAPTPP
ncbi:MAG TPA: glycosyltransferase family 87 protein [Gemmatimonadales bacterium]|nr:glycosyltransferase family 87 protein [Gemmatimonadales bacterium]